MELSKQNMKRLCFLIFFAMLLFWMFNHSVQVWSICKTILSILAPFIVGFCFAFIINVLLRPLEALWKRFVRFKYAKQCKRPACLILSALIFVGVVFILLFMVVPELKTTITSVIEQVPAYRRQVLVWWEEFSVFLAQHSIVLPEFTFDFEKIGNLISDFLSEQGTLFFNKTMDWTSSIFTTIFNSVLGIVFAFYVLFQKERLGNNAKKVIQSLLPNTKADALIRLADLCDRTFTKFVTGQLVEACIIGTLCFIGMNLFRMPYALMISTLVGFTALIPVFGAFIGTGVGAFLIVMVDPMKAFWFIVFIIILQQLEGDLIYPKVVGKSVGLPSIWVLVAVTIGASFGVLGMLLSVPICSVVYCVGKSIINARLHKKKLAPLED